MKNLISVALILLLGITLTESTGEFKFGDIIAFERMCGIDKTVYKHYAIYVGPRTGIDVGQGDNDILHLTVLSHGDGVLPLNHFVTGRNVRDWKYNLKLGKTCMVSETKFGKLEEVKKTSRVLKDNYLDEVEGFKIQYNKNFEDQMKTRIMDTYGKWSVYRPFNNNCELFATNMRYGKPSFKQTGTLVEPLLQLKESATQILKNIPKFITMESECPFTGG